MNDQKLSLAPKETLRLQQCSCRHAVGNRLLLLLLPHQNIKTISVLLVLLMSKYSLNSPQWHDVIIK
jgi:hypothetical protein